MRIVIRLLLGLLGLIVVAAIGAAVWARFFFDADRYRPQIEAQIETQLGRDVTLGPGLSVSLLPWLGVETGSLTVANAAGVETSMLQASRARVAVRLLPLLTGSVEADTVELDGVVLHLQRNAAGKGNWEFTQKPAQNDPVSSKDPAKSALALAAIGGVRMQNAEIHWRDLAAGQVIALRDVNLEAGAYAPDAEWPIALSATYTLGEGAKAQRGRFDIDTDLALDLATQQIRFNKLKARLNDSTLQGDLSATLGASIPALRFNLTLDRLDLDAYLQAANGTST
ncbi:MAG: AsmA family protein, partial [Gammaproteobacteria bacterium]